METMEKELLIKKAKNVRDYLNVVEKKLGKEKSPIIKSLKTEITDKIHLGYKILEAKPSELTENILRRSAILSENKLRKLIEESFSADTFKADYAQNKDWIEFFIGPCFQPIVEWLFAKLPKITYSIRYSRRSVRNSKNSYLYFSKIFMFIDECYDFLIQQDNWLTIYNGTTPLDFSQMISADSISGQIRLSNIMAYCIDSGHLEVISHFSDVLTGEGRSSDLSYSFWNAVFRAENQELIEKTGQLLLTAQRQEGLRQSILESVDQGCFEHFVYFVDLIVKHDLIRFNSVIRSIMVWVGMYDFDISRTAYTKKVISLVHTVLTDNEGRKKLLGNSDDLMEVYISLWGGSARDSSLSEEDIDLVLKDPADYKQIAIIEFLNILQNDPFKYKIIEKIVSQDPTNEVVAWTLGAMNLTPPWNLNYTVQGTLDSKYANNHPTMSPDFTQLLYDKYMRLLHSEKKVNIVFTNTGILNAKLTIHKNKIQNALIILAFVLEDEEKLDEMGELLGRDMPTFYVQNHLNTINNEKQRYFLISALGANTETVVKQAEKYIVLMDLYPTKEEALLLESFLRFKSDFNRRSTLFMLARQSPKELLESAERLISGKTLEHRLGGLDLILNTITKDERFAEIAQQGKNLALEMKISSPAEQVLVDQIAGGAKEEYSVEDGFGLFTETEEVPPLPAPKIVKKFNFKKAFFPLSVSEFEGYYNTLVSYIEEHKEKQETVEDANYLGEDATYILGNYPILKINRGKNKGRILFKELWDDFFEAHAYPLDFRYEFAYCWDRASSNVYSTPILDKIYDKHYPVKEIEKKKEIISTSRMNALILAVLGYHFRDSLPEDRFDDIIDALSLLYREIPDSEYKYKSLRPNDKKEIVTNRVNSSKYVKVLFGKMWQYAFRYPNTCAQNTMVITNAFFQKSFPFEDYDLNSPGTYGKYMYFLDSERVAHAYELGIVSRNYLLNYTFTYPEKNDILNKATNRRGNYRGGNDFRKNYPKTCAVIEELVEILVSIESFRGDSPTIATAYIGKVYHYVGTHHFVNLLARLDKKDTFIRGYIYGNNISKKRVLSELIQNCHPSEGETPESFKEKLDNETIDVQILLNAAMYSKQWIPLVSSYVGWNHLESLMWYFRAHTAESNHNAEDEIARYSDIPVGDFENGAFDIKWFFESYNGVGAKKFPQVYESAKYISSAGQHRRAQIFADAALGKLTFKEVEEKINKNRSQDHVRVYGIMPMKKNRSKDLMDRYLLLQKFAKDSKKFGAQRQSSERLAVNIGLDNLARTAGYPNTTTLLLVLEGQISKDSMEILKPRTFGDYQVEVENTESGKYKIMVTNDKGKQLKSVPAPLRKIPEFVELQDTVKGIGEQYSRSVKSFERLMETGDSLGVDDLVTMMESDVFHALLRDIVFTNGTDFGYLKEDKLVTPGGTATDLPKKSSLTVAHPYDLYKGEIWAEYQKDLFTRQVSQPFKQVFRELYVPTKDERTEGTSRRYAGHQVQGQQLLGLMKARGWVNAGQRVFYGHNITAELYGINAEYSPADIGEPVLEIIRFTDRLTGKQVNIEDVPPVVFSEIMRDVDLFVSVAYVGGVDPEASLSTIEMRTAIVREMLPLLKIDNVKLEGNFAFVKGSYGEYNIHLGSANVQKMGRGSIYMVVVAADHRGRLFLPFMDPDPKTAEVVSKILLMARDEEIKDPSIIEQIK